MGIGEEVFQVKGQRSKFLASMMFGTDTNLTILDRPVVHRRHRLSSSAGLVDHPRYRGGRCRKLAIICQLAGTWASAFVVVV